VSAIKRYWEKRSERYGREIEGVLFKSLPKPLNEYLHNWSWEQVREGVELLGEKKVKILDMGSGYGRLSREILANYENARIAGVDISSNYVRLYNEELRPRGRAVVADIKKLPFKDKSFDAVIMVVSMVCLKGEENQSKAMTELMRVLKPGGRFVIIESNKSGYDLVTLGGLIGGVGGGKEGPVPAVDVRPEFVKKSIRRSGGMLTCVSGIPVWTITLHLSAVMSFLWPSLGRIFLKVVYRLDKLFGKFVKPSLYVSYVGYKSE